MSMFGQFVSSIAGSNNIQPEYSTMMSTTNQEFGDDEEDVITDDMTSIQLQAILREFSLLRQENESIKNSISVLQNDRDKLRIAVQKLKAENNRFKSQLKRVTGVVTAKRSGEGGDAMDTAEGNAAADMLDETFDFEDIGDFLLIGDINDPLAIQYRAPIRDANGIEHKSAERYLWYKMAETFDDKDSMTKILNTDNPSTAEMILKNIKGFDQKAWDAVKLRHWEDGQRLKFDQFRSLKCLLIKTGKFYLAVASQDKFFGTGWRKIRDESARPHMWDGENRGGKSLMKLRDEYAANHAWTTAQEEIEAQNSFNENRRRTWRKAVRDDSRPSGGGRGDRGGKRTAPMASGRNNKNGSFSGNSNFNGGNNVNPNFGGGGNANSAYGGGGSANHYFGGGGGVSPYGNNMRSRPLLVSPYLGDSSSVPVWPPAPGSFNFGGGGMGYNKRGRF